MRHRLDADQAKLYELIWIRTIASQMESAELERTTVDIAAKAGSRVLELRATGQVVKFDGFLALYQEGRDDDGDDEDSRRLPAMSEGEALKRKDLAVTQHFTEPPPRFSEASLVKRMEELGIGRPSTYASILQVLKDRGYVKLDKKRLHGEDKGRVVVAFLENFFARYVEYDFTAALEEQLDRISNNEISWQQVLQDFWGDFIGAVNEIKDLRVTQVLDALDDMLGPHIYAPREDGGDPRQCPTCGTGKLNLKAGKFGAFVGCTNYPECRYTRPLAADSEASADRILGKDPVSDLEVVVKAGRFGPYIQLGEPKDYAEGEKPKRAGIPKNMSPGDIELDLALKLLSLPREIGKHPETGEPITAGTWPFRPLRAPREDLCQPRGRRRGIRHRAQPRGDADCREDRKGPERPPLRRRSRQAAGRSSDPWRCRGQERPLRRLCHGRRRQRHDPQRQDAGNHHAAGSHRADRRTGGKGRRQAEARREEGQGAAKPAKVEAAAKAPKPAKKAVAKKSAAKPKSDAASKARAPVTATATTSPAKVAKPVAKKTVGKASG